MAFAACLSSLGFLKSDWSEKPLEYAAKTGDEVTRRSLQELRELRAHVDLCLLERLPISADRRALRETPVDLRPRRDLPKITRHAETHVAPLSTPGRRREGRE